MIYPQIILIFDIFYPSWSIQTPHHVIAHEIDEDRQSKPQLARLRPWARLLNLKDVPKLITLIETDHIMSFRHLFLAGPFVFFEKSTLFWRRNWITLERSISQDASRKEWEWKAPKVGNTLGWLFTLSQYAIGSQMKVKIGWDPRTFKFFMILVMNVFFFRIPYALHVTIGSWETVTDTGKLGLPQKQIGLAVTIFASFAGCWLPTSGFGIGRFCGQNPWGHLF